MKTELVAGIDIGGTNTQLGLVNKNGTIIYADRVSTKTFPDPIDLVNSLADKIDLFLQKNIDNYSLKGIGIGAPNGNYFMGTVEFAPNLDWKGVVPLSDYFFNRLHVPTFLTNDANAAALGEMIFGSAKNIKDFLFITLGTGLGSGIVVNGELVYGHDGFAGEIGHVIVQPEGRKCGCGRYGCLETYCSATALSTTYSEFAKNKSHLNAKEIYERAIEGDAAAIKSFEYTGNILGLTLANSVAYTSPEAIFLFGGLAMAGNLLFEPTRLSFEKNLLPIYKNNVKILPSGLKESDAAVLGAASLIWTLHK